MLATVATILTALSVFVIIQIFYKQKDSEKRKQKELFWAEWQIKNHKMRKQYSNRVHKEFERLKSKYDIA